MNEWWLLTLLIGLTLLTSVLIVYPLRRHLIVSLLLIPVIFVLVFGGYHYWGSFDSWQSYSQNLKKQKQAQALLKSVKNPQQLIEMLRARLNDSPKSAQGWYLLGKLYANQNDQQKAVNSFAKAYQFNPAEESYAVHYAHSLWQANQRRFTEQVREIFLNLLKNNSHQPDALAMLAMDAYNLHHYEQAIKYWQRLLQQAPPQSEEAQAVRRAIAQAEENARNK